MTFQAVAQMSNDRSLVIGEITTKEAESANGEDSGFDGAGLYLIEVNSRHPDQPGRILAKFLSESAATVLARFFRIHGHLESMS
jgi:hypothetical protein